MCGIAGVVGIPQNSELVSEMLDIMYHRGPDWNGYYRSDEISMGHCRLSINDLSENANQPFVSPAHDLAVAVNGEIYNFQSFKKVLQNKGYNFKSKSDSEIILHAYIEFGLDFISDLNGMFAIAIWDDRRKTLFLARDRLGIKPLYYTKAKDRFIFASEIKALAVCDEVALSIDKQSLAEYLAFENYFSNRTLNKDIKLVEPAEIVKYSFHDQSIVKHFYWKPQSDFAEDDPKQVYRKYNEAIESAMERHLVSDVPLGCYLSGGIDSSSVAYWASKKTGPGLQTFTGHFGMNGFFDEASDASKVAEALRSKNRQVSIGPDDFKNNIEKVLWHLDEPRVGMGSFSQFMVARKAAKHVKVILTGHGGDELFAGYPVFKSIYGKQNIADLLTRSSARELLFSAYFSIYPMLRKEACYFLPNIYSLRSFKDLLQEDLYQDMIQNTDIYQEPEKLKQECGGSDYNRLTLTYLKYYLPSLFLVEDKISMAFSLESRTPLCDNEMLDLGMSLPLSLKLTDYELKHIPRQAMRGKLPDLVYRLPKKGFPTPLGKWFKNELSAYVSDFIFSNLSEVGIFNEKEVRRLVGKHQRSRLPYPFDEISAHKIWVIINLIHYTKNQKARYKNVTKVST